MFMYDWCYLFFISTIPVNKFFLILQIQFELCSFIFFFYQNQDMYATEDLRRMISFEFDLFKFDYITKETSVLATMPNIILLWSSDPNQYYIIRTWNAKNPC